MLYSFINRYVLPVLGTMMTMLTPMIAQACAVCMDASDDPISQGLRWSLRFMMAMPFTVAGAIAGILLYSRRRRVRTRFNKNVRVTPGLDIKGE
ncbi:MAG TPA: hypothetical protein VNM22_01440 [Candidatus Limnocylindrales bacterium]|nr:hypothetical protein [Candidatus Limnocylindrales bacterium]